MTVPVTAPPPDAAPAAVRSPWLAGKPGPFPPARHLYCFPHSGGMAAEYVRWGRELPETHVYGISLPGRAGRLSEEPMTDLDTLVNALLDTTAFTPPYVLFGHSLGGLVAYEVTRALAQRGLPMPGQLVVSSYPAPHLPRHAPRLHDRPDAELVRALDERYGGIPPRLAEEPGLMDLFLPAFRADLTLLENHVHRDGPPVTVPLHVFGGDEDTVTSAQLEQWDRHSTRPVRRHRFPGGHFYFREHPAAVFDTLAALL